MSEEKVEKVNSQTETDKKEENSNQKDQVQSLIEKEKERIKSIPSGKAKSGRAWKEKNHKFSNLLIQKANRTSWDKKMELKNEKNQVKKYEQKLKEEKKQKKIDLVRRQKLNAEKRKENEKKAEIVQKVKNSAKLKRIKKKLLRKV